MGGMGGGRAGHRQQRRRGEDTVHPLRVTLEDLHNSKVSKLKLRKKVICDGCRGSGGKGNAVQKCHECRGQGVKISIQPIGPGMVQQVQRTCGNCQGEGEVIDPKNRCKKCLGKKVVEEIKVLEVEVDKGMKDGQKITFAEEGDQQPGIKTGDVIIVLQQQPHNRFTRNGNDLHMKLTIGLTEALCGFKIPVQHLDKRELLITSKSGEVIVPGGRRVVLDEGMPVYRNSMEKGHLYIEFDVIFPQDNSVALHSLKSIEALLPARQTQMDQDSDICEVELVDFDESSSSHRDMDDDEEDEDARHGGGHAHGGAPPGMQCANQ
jgi:DnaJ family protein A protein 2